MSGTKRNLLNNEYQAAINANSPSDTNPFATINDISIAPTAAISTCIFQYVSTADHSTAITNHTFTAEVGYIYEVIQTLGATYDNESDEVSNLIKLGGTTVLRGVFGGIGGTYNGSNTLNYLIVGDGNPKAIGFECTFSGGVVFTYTACFIKKTKIA